MDIFYPLHKIFATDILLVELNLIYQKSRYWVMCGLCIRRAVPRMMGKLVSVFSVASLFNAARGLSHLSPVSQCRYPSPLPPATQHASVWDPFSQNSALD